MRGGALVASCISGVFVLVTVFGRADEARVSARASMPRRVPDCARETDGKAAGVLGTSTAAGSTFDTVRHTGPMSQTYNSQG